MEHGENDDGWSRQPNCLSATLAFLFLTTFLLSLKFLFHVSEHTLEYVIGKSGARAV